MNTLLRHLTFEPHGKKLRTSAAAFWLFSVHIPVAAMAISEAIAWGYLGSLFGEGLMRWFCAGFMGIIVFLIVWVIDVSLITLDRAGREHAAAILQQKSRSSQAVEFATFGLRILLLVGSLAITAPYLAQLVFHKDIQRAVNEEATMAIDTARKQIAAKFDKTLSDRDKAIEAQRQRYEQEVAGKGPSGRYGAGPAAQAVHKDLESLMGARDITLRDREATLQAFDLLAANWNANRDQLAASYGVQIPQESILENRKVMEALSRRPEFRSTEMAIRGFLGFIFAGILLLKLFEPRSVRLYLSDVLQQEYDRYLAGTFDIALPPSERSTNKLFQISPQRLYEFLVKVWVPSRLLETQQANVHARTSAAMQALNVLETMRSTLDAELDHATTEVQRVCATVDEASENLTQLRSSIMEIKSDLFYYQNELADLETPPTSLDEKSLLEYGVKRLEYRSYLQKRISEASRALEVLENNIPGETEKFNRANAALQRVDTKLKEKDDELAATQAKIRSIREELRLSAGARAHSLLSAT